MRNTWDYEAFKHYITDAAALLPNVKTQADIARVTDVTPSLLSKWFRGQEQPSIPSLVKVRDGFVANGIQVQLGDLLKLTGRLPQDEEDTEAGTHPAAPAFVLVHPIAREIDAMLSDASPISADNRATLEGVLDHVVERYRSMMRQRRPA